MQTVEITYPRPPHQITWIESGAGTVEVTLELTMQREDETDFWSIIAASAKELAPYVMGRRLGMVVLIDRDTPDAWLDWCRTPEFLARHGSDIEEAANRQWERDSE